MVSTKEIYLVRQARCIPFWQRNFFKHIIRDDESLSWDYVMAPTWRGHRENPLSQRKGEFATWLDTFKRTPALSRGRGGS